MVEFFILLSSIIILKETKSNKKAIYQENKTSELIKRACPLCGGSIELEREAKRIKCPYCDNEVTVSDDVSEKKDVIKLESKKNPFVIYCKNCGSLAEYDIASQSYRCKYCGQTSGIEEVKKEFIQWRQLQQESLKREESDDISCNCPNCGSVMLFARGEASKKCVFCGSALVRNEFEQSINYPELIIPFAITKKEALQKLDKWCKDNYKSPESKEVSANINLLQACYLPYQMIEGPMDVTIYRDATQRIYHCDGYLEGSMVCTAEKIDNLVLQAAEPFDPKGLVRFEHGYIAGQQARLQDISDYTTSERLKREVSEDYRPYVEKVMQTKGCYLTLSSDTLMNAPVLVPMYIISKDNLFLAINGQTGKIAVSISRYSKEYIKLLEPILFTLATLLVSLWLLRNETSFDTRILLPCGLALIMFLITTTARETEIKTISTRIILTSDESINKKKEKFENNIKTKNNIPVFYEMINGNKVKVDIKFYPISRIISIILKGLAFIFLPYIIAVAIKIIPAGGFRNALKLLDLSNGFLWLIFMFALVPGLYIKMYRQEVYNHPYIYERALME